MVHIVRTSWSGLSGGLGLTQLAVDYTVPAFGAMTPGDAQAAVNAVRAYWDAIKALLPNELQLTVSPVVDYYLVNNAELAGSATAATSPVSVLGTSSLDYSMAAGLKVNLNTGVIRNGRRVRGSIFLVPLAGAFSATGTAGATAKTTINAAGTSLMSALATAGLKLCVWSRPLEATDPKGPRDGALSVVSAMETSEKTAVLRGRRD